jgi:hypothetical protein
MRASDARLWITRWLALAACATLATGCYTVRLQPVTAAPAGEPIPIPTTVDVPAATASKQHEVRSGLAGFANSWNLEIGRAVDEYARAYLGQTFPPGRDMTVRVDLVRFDVQGFGASTDLRFTVSDQAQQQLFQRDYRCVGKGRGGRVALGGAFAMKSAMRGTTDEALRSCFEQFLADARVEASRWRREIAANTGGGPLASRAGE